MKPITSEALARYRITKGKGFRLRNHAPDDEGKDGLAKEEAPELLARGIERLAVLQDRLYAQNRWSVLCLFQAMDAAGKDGTIKHVFSGVNPQGCHATSFKAPSNNELDQDFLRRHVAALPSRGQIGIHNRSWYEEVLVVRIHPDILARQQLPGTCVTKHIWRDRLEDIAAYERYLSRQGVVVLKFYLNLSREEQRRRFLSRLDEPEKNWKFRAGDVAERRHWKSYMTAYEEAIRATATPEAPWYIVPADQKWHTRLIVVAAIVDALEKLDLRYPPVSEADRAAFAEARASLA